MDRWINGLLVCRIVYNESKIDFKLRAQIADAAQSVSSNISEGYSRRSIHEYIQHVYIALGSLSESLTRAIGFKAADQITQAQFDEIDTLHYEVENNLWRLLESLEKRVMKALGSHAQRKTLMIIFHRKPNNPVIQ